MKIARKRRNRIDIAESGALSDLAFLLIVFFIVIAVFNINKGFLIELPKKDSHKIVSSDDIVRVFLDEDGTLFVRGEKVSAGELENKVKEVRDIRPNMTFMLAIHPQTRYQNVVEIVELVRTLEIDNFSFAMKENNQ